MNAAQAPQAPSSVSVKFDTKPRLTIGFVVLPSDIPLDLEVHHLLSQVQGVTWRMTRMAFADHDESLSGENFEKAKKNISVATSVFMPADR